MLNVFFVLSKPKTNKKKELGYFFISGLYKNLYFNSTDLYILHRKKNLFKNERRRCDGK